VRVEDNGEASPKVLGTLEVMKSCKELDEPEFIIGEPTEDDRQKAQRIFDGGEDFISKEKAAAWMGEQGPVRQRTLQAYMELHNFSGLSVLASLREVCGRLVLRAETQQVDRILVAFSKRWCSCNSRHGFKATGTLPCRGP
jgi:Sec7-like guanine-nucleotide exchange factor